MAFLKIARDEIEVGIDIVAVLNEKQFFLNLMGGKKSTYCLISVNKEKSKEDFILSAKDLINNQFVLLQRKEKLFCS
jgi:tyrosyl-tRNA synthetase